MNINPETDLDLEKLFLPAWAQESPSVNRYAKFAGGEDRPEHDDRRGPRPPRRDAGPRGFGGGGRGDNRGRPPRRDGDKPRGRGDDRFAPRQREERDQRETPPPMPEVAISLVPDEKGVESLARQVKMTGRAYPLFDIARLILQKPERYAIRFAVEKNAEGKVVQPLFVCALDETLWLSEDEAVEHVLRGHFATFYQADRTATEPPKGKYTFVGQCGLSGVIFGPPNHHDYQNRLHKLHSERFSRMPFEVYKSRVKIVRDEEVVKKWVEEQSWKTEYICLNVPEPLKLANREDVEQHFRTVHKDTIIKPVEMHTLSGVAARGMRCHGLARFARQVCEDQRRFPLQIATVLSQQFAGHALQFFKVNKTVTHVSVARPHYLDLETTPVSEGVRQIVDFINAHPKCTRRKLFETLAPSPPPAPIPVNPPAPEVEPNAPAPAEAAESTPKPAEPEPTPEQTAVNGDLHWLIHQGHVIEFANGTLETAKKPLPKPPRPEKKPAEVTAAVPAATPSAVAATESPSESVSSESTTAETVALPEAPTAEAPAEEKVTAVAEAIPVNVEETPAATEVVAASESESAPKPPAPSEAPPA
ncbi:MAG: hypothetical protein IH623_11885 [Verrucomicrobia bacterium]|nr:hypothetical protein [Verrucomicrobiota bacterium]